MIKIMLVFGTRPEAIKMTPLVKELQMHPEDFETIVCVTGQHREMLDQVLRIFEITPDFDLNIMKQGQDLYDVTARILNGMRNVFKECTNRLLRTTDGNRMTTSDCILLHCCSSASLTAKQI